MAAPGEIAVAHQKRQKRLQQAAVAVALSVWQRLNEDVLTPSWADGVGMSMVRAVTRFQLQAATDAGNYLEELAAAQGALAGMEQIVPSVLAGVASDGRPLESLLYLPIILVKRLLAGGVRPPEAMRQARNFLAVIAATQVADAGRGATAAGIAANRSWVTYVRVVGLPACSRCVILAGREYSWSAGFLRHPACDCGMMPVRGGDGRLPTPGELFARMSADEQDRRFGKATAEAIRLGGDMRQVVNARRGMQVAAGRKVTTEGTSRGGIAGRRMGAATRRVSAVRPMPEQILRDADGDRDEAIRLLRRFGYLV